ncbi:hypothetical protein [Oryza sativa Japonica Group]|uniref:Uncharacterized protein n=1 Tax=Oryza sativa subsp. japonica TaxID=39947 RepID=Q5ZDD8_ORYSJ|nr:hypothetical protein [Oryza sativa Japonica Group]
MTVSCGLAAELEGGRKQQQHARRRVQDDKVDARRWEFDRVSYQMVPVYTSSKEEAETDKGAKVNVVLGVDGR